MSRKVLIVEDEIIDSMALASVLPSWGFDVADTVTSGEDAVRAAEDIKPLAIRL